MDTSKLICCTNNFGRHLTYAEARKLDMTEIKLLADMQPEEIRQLVIERVRKNPEARCAVGASVLNQKQMLQILLSQNQHFRTVLHNERHNIAKAQEQLNAERTRERTYVPPLRSTIRAPSRAATPVQPARGPVPPNPTQTNTLVELTTIPTAPTRELVQTTQATQLSFGFTAS